MPKNKAPGLIIAAFTVFTLAAIAEDSPSNPTNATAAKPPEAISTNSAGTNAPARKSKSQSDAASKTTTLGKISKADQAYQSALDAHALEPALKQQNQDGAFKGTVTGIFEPRSGGLAIMNFDTNYRSALTALLRGNDFAKFPDLKTLVGKDVLVSGKFIAYQGRAEIILTNIDQIKLVEAAK